MTAPTAPIPSVRCRGLAKDYGSGNTRVKALRGVDLDVHDGELLMLVGPSGCGKTTLLSLVAGSLDPSAGALEVMGHDLHTMIPREITRWRGRHVGFVFQQFNLLPTLSAAENAAIPRMILGDMHAASVARARALLARVGLEGREDALPAQLSGGQQQRVAVARALIHEPRLLVCDEPTSALDHHTGLMIMKLLRDEAVRPGRTVMVVTHDERIFPFAERIARMDDGRVVDVRAMPPADNQG